MIISVDGVTVNRNKELSSVFADSEGRTLKLKIERNGEENNQFHARFKRRLNL